MGEKRGPRLHGIEVLENVGMQNGRGEHSPRPLKRSVDVESNSWMWVAVDVLAETVEGLRERDWIPACAGMTVALTLSLTRGEEIMRIAVCRAARE